MDRMKYVNTEVDSIDSEWKLWLQYDLNWFEWKSRNERMEYGGPWDLPRLKTEQSDSRDMSGSSSEGRQDVQVPLYAW